VIFDYIISPSLSFSSFGLFEIDQHDPRVKIIIHNFVIPSLPKFIIPISFLHIYSKFQAQKSY